MPLAPLDTRHLPAGVHSRFVESVNGLRMHLLEAGHEKPGQPLLLLLHGFPEIAYSWRKVIVPLAELGYHVVAPDQRGYGRTTGWSATYDQDLRLYSMLNLARDAVALTFALGYRQAAAVVRRDFSRQGLQPWCALSRPVVSRACRLAERADSARPPTFAFDTPAGGILASRGTLPMTRSWLGRHRPRKPSRRFYTPGPPTHMCHNPEGVVPYTACLLPLQERRLDRERASSARGLFG